jgi:hypothetical protein
MGTSGHLFNEPVANIAIAGFRLRCALLRLFKAMALLGGITNLIQLAYLRRPFFEPRSIKRPQVFESIELVHILASAGRSTLKHRRGKQPLEPERSTRFRRVAKRTFSLLARQLASHPKHPKVSFQVVPCILHGRFLAESSAKKVGTATYILSVAGCAARRALFVAIC